MSSKPKQTPWIVATQKNNGLWCKEKKTTLSLINGHVARNRAARSEKRNRGQDWHLQPRNNRQPLQQVAPANSPEGETNYDTHIHPDRGISWLGLQAIFSDTVSVQGERYTTSGPAVTCEVPQYPRKAVTHNTYAVRVMPVFQPKSHPSVNLPSRPRYPYPHHGTTMPPWPFTPDIPMRVNGGQSLFSTLAIEVSANEKELLHFFMAKGRRVLFGTSAAPQFCPGISTFLSGMLQTNPMFVATHIVMAEFMLSKLRSVQLSENFYRRRASTYRSVVALTSDPSATVKDQIEGMMLLSLVEHVMDRPDLQGYHLRAMNELTESKVGRRGFLQEASTDLRSYYSAHYAFGGVVVARNSPAATDSMLAFVSWLRKIRAWTKLQTSRLTPFDFTNDLTLLRSYFSFGIHQHLTDINTPFFPGSGFFYVLFNLCATMAEWPMELHTSQLLLSTLQDNLIKSADDDSSADAALGDSHNQGIYRFHPNVLAPPIPHIAYDVQASKSPSITPVESEESFLKETKTAVEVAVADASINAMHAFSLLSPSARSGISYQLLECCMMNKSPTVLECFPENELADLVSEMHRT